MTELPPKLIEGLNEVVSTAYKDSYGDWHLTADEGRIRKLCKAAAGEGWQDWSGGDCPLPDPMVEYRRRDGGTGDGNASSLIGWVHFDRGSDIVAYRVLPTPPIQGDAK